MVSIQTRCNQSVIGLSTLPRLPSLQRATIWGSPSREWETANSHCTYGRSDLYRALSSRPLSDLPEQVVTRNLLKTYLEPPSSLRVSLAAELSFSRRDLKKFAMPAGIRLASRKTG